MGERPPAIGAHYALPSTAVDAAFAIRHPPSAIGSRHFLTALENLPLATPSAKLRQA
jgi:hypothetical protein